MKKHLLTVALSCALATGLVTASFAQMTSGPTTSAGGASSGKSDPPGGNPSNSATTAGPSGASTGTGGTGGSTGKGGSGIGKTSRDTSEDRVPHN